MPSAGLLCPGPGAGARQGTSTPLGYLCPPKPHYDKHSVTCSALLGPSAACLPHLWVPLRETVPDDS